MARVVPVTTGTFERPMWKRAIPFAVVIAMWWLITSGLQIVPPFAIPSPESVWHTIVRYTQQGILLHSILASIGRMLGGFFIGAFLGVALGLWVGSNRVTAIFMEPIAKFFQAVAGPTWIPLAVLWFGMSWFSVSFIVLNTVFFIVFYNTLMGVQTVNRRLVDSVHTLGGNAWHILREVRIPGAIPSILVGARLGIGYGWRALIAGEIIASGRGLGVLIWEGQRHFRVPDIVLGLLLIGVISMVMDKLLMRPLERRTVERWGMVDRAA